MRVPRALRGELSETDLDRIEEAIRKAEQGTSRELRVRIIRRLLPLENPRRRALRDFHALGMQHTADGAGVLLFLAVKSRRFEIVADPVVDANIGAEAWEGIARGITDEIREHGIGKGLEYGIQRIGGFLARHFPIQPDDANELSDEVSFG